MMDWNKNNMVMVLMDTIQFLLRYKFNPSSNTVILIYKAFMSHTWLQFSSAWNHKHNPQELRETQQV